MSPKELNQYAFDLRQSGHALGMTYGVVPHAGHLWRLAALGPNFESHLATLGAEPTEEDFARLNRLGVWLGEGKPPRLALVCEGMGALWPHAGRELYDTFPVAREAMERIQAISSWDVLGLMDEEDIERITATRWQIPYLFLLEYAQWALLRSLGLEPALVCGHSLGELIALCCAGIYSPEVAWHILDTRAEHVSALEAQAAKNFGMLAVHAEEPVITEILAANAEVRVANYNTPTQFILGGPKEVLLSLRKQLRRHKIPAVSLSVSLLFHHPQMRILRDFSLLRLQALSMHKPQIPCLSVSKCLFYPDEQAEICRFIADLDENPVRFREMVALIGEQQKIDHFLEIGPQDVLCGLIRENAPDAWVLSCGRKASEALAMRTVCCALYAKGLLKGKDLGETLHGRWFVQSGDAPKEHSLGDESKAPLAKEESKSPWAAHDAAIIELLAELSGVARSEIKREMDLRYDLAVRSSSFPRLLLKAEELYGRTLSFESLLHVATVADLLAVLHGEKLKKNEEGSRSSLERPALLESFVLQNGTFLPTRYAAFLTDAALQEMAIVVLNDLSCVEQEERTRLSSLFADLFSSLFATLSRCFLSKELLTLLGTPPQHCTFLPLHKTYQGPILFIDCTPLLKSGALQSFGAGLPHERALFLRFFQSLEEAMQAKKASVPCRTVACILPRTRCFEALGDLLAREFLLGREEAVFWGEEEVLRSYQGNDAPQRAGLAHLPLPKLFSTDCTLPWVGTAERLEQQKRSAASVRTLQEKVFFSRERDRTEEGRRTLPLSMGLATLLLCAHKQTPWLTFLGCSDLSIGTIPVWVDGATLEGTVSATLMSWLWLQKNLVREQHAELKMYALTENGRKRALTPFLSAHMLFGRDRFEVPLNPSLSSQGEASTCTDLEIEAFYDKLSLSSPWRLLQKIEQHQGGRYTALVDGEALLDDWLAMFPAAQPSPLYYFMLYFEGITQACQRILPLSSTSMAPVALGFLRMGSLEDNLVAQVEIVLDQTIVSETRSRFEVTVHSGGVPLLTLSNFEWLHCASA